MISKIPGELENVLNMDPERVGGEPCFNGTRVPLASVVDSLGAGYSTEEILSDFPSLNEEQVRAVQKWELSLARKELLAS